MTSHESPGAPARLTVGVVSAGRVGTALGQAWEHAGHLVVATSAISDASRRRAADRLPDAVVLPPDEVAGRVDLLLLAVPDDALAGLVAGLASTGAVRPGQIVVHTCGARGVGVLEPLTRLGALPLALHPAMTFTGHPEDTARLASCCFGVTARDELGWAVGEALVLEVGAEPVRVAEADRETYHAALAHGANHLVTLVRDAVQVLESVTTGGVPAERLLSPLLSAALDNALRHGDRALTGPVARGDAAAVAAHLRVLRAVDPELAEAYRALSRRTAQRAEQHALITAAAARAVLEELS
ncbi:DUF2520 domain-containing protein [Rhodococcus antarcticus]|uniref:DUF2520 domain-containing protein n=1 Tax=Rhodococcus antarcticus TaxID=2987751 RepID=A0ABY6NYF3_9NOCA|nr:DUF2520 domain-containing protein [Rhodococcus antarcticus]UZJ24419.1 DUF2520 domain-containing protein [Rhodococcus antarcticus]